MVTRYFVQYWSIEDEQAALIIRDAISKQMGIPIGNNCTTVVAKDFVKMAIDTVNLGQYAISKTDTNYVVAVGAQGANPFFYALANTYKVISPITSEGQSLIQVIDNYRAGSDGYGYPIYIKKLYAVGGWSKEDTLRAANYIAQKGLPSATINVPMTATTPKVSATGAITSLKRLAGWTFQLTTANRSPADGNWTLVGFRANDPTEYKASMIGSETWTITMPAPTSFPFAYNFTLRYSGNPIGTIWQAIAFSDGTVSITSFDPAKPAPTDVVEFNRENVLKQIAQFEQMSAEKIAEMKSAAMLDVTGAATKSVNEYEIMLQSEIAKLKSAVMSATTLEQLSAATNNFSSTVAAKTTEIQSKYKDLFGQMGDVFGAIPKTLGEIGNWILWVIFGAIALIAAWYLLPVLTKKS